MPIAIAMVFASHALVHFLSRIMSDDGGNIDGGLRVNDFDGFVVV